MFDQTVDPYTWAGRTCVFVNPSPICADLLLPQQYAAPESVIPHVCDAPAEMTDHWREPDTTVGTFLEVTVPSPSWPVSFAPQQ